MSKHQNATSRKKADPSRRRGRERRIRIRSELRDQPDLQKIASTVVALALAQAEKDAQAAETVDTSDTGNRR